MTFKRVHPAPVSPTAQTPAGLVICPQCGKRIRPSARKRPHEGDAECRALQVVHSYTARGWSQVHNSKHAEIIEEAGAPMEWAPGGIHVETKAADDRGHTRDEMVQHNVGFAPDGVIRVMNLLARVQLPPQFRRRAIKVLWDKDELLSAIDSTRRLGGSTRSFVHQCVMQVEREVAELQHGQDEERYEGPA